MSKNLKGKNLEVNINITQAGTFNADIFNAYSDFTLNGVSQVNRITTNEVDIVDLKADVITAEADIVVIHSDIVALQTDVNALEVDVLALQTGKQNNLTIQQTISPSTSAIASSNAIIAYVSSATPSITASQPLLYSGGNLSALFDAVPTSSSTSFLSSGTLYTYLNTKQDNLTIQQTISASSTEIASSDAIINYVTSSVPSITATSPLVYSGGNLSGIFDTYPTNLSTNFLTSSTIYNNLITKQEAITSSVALNSGSITSSGIISAVGSITGFSLVGDIFSNISAGTGIVLSQNTPSLGITEISAPNAVFSTSTQYAFQATSNFNAGQTITAGVKPQLNLVELCVPLTSAYNTSTYTYTCPVSGIYSFGFKIFINTIVTDAFRLGIYKNGLLISQGGGAVGTTEGFDTIQQCYAGDTIYIAGVSGSAVCYMAQNHSWVYGSLLQPVNNTISASTELNIDDLNANTANIPTATIQNLICPLVGLSRMYSRGKTSQDSSLTTSLYTDFNVLVQDSIYCSYVAPATDTGSATSGIKILVAGTYKLDYTFNAYNISFNNRVSWWSRVCKNWTPLIDQKTFIYTRGNNAQYAQYGSSATSFIITLEVNDYLLLLTKVAKNTPNFSGDFSLLKGDTGSTMTLEYLGL